MMEISGDSTEPEKFDKKFLVVAFLLVVFVLGGLLFWWSKGESPENDEAAIRALVEGFGRTLQRVSLEEPDQTLSISIQDNYQEFLSTDFLQSWVNNPWKAIGRLTISPFPDRIEISQIEKIAPNRYRVSGEVIEVTSIEVTEGDDGVAARYGIELLVEKIEGHLFITSVSAGEYSEQPREVFEEYQGDSFSIEYPKGFILEEGEGLGGGFLDVSLLRISYPEDAFEAENTNYIEAYVVVSESMDPPTIVGCTTFNDVEAPDVKTGTSKVISGSLFSNRVVKEAFTGSTYESVLYRTVRNEKCYEIALVAHTGNLDSYEAPISLFDTTRAFKVLEDIFGSFQFIEQDNTPRDEGSEAELDS